MKRILKENILFIIGFIIFIAVFSRYFLFLLSIEVFNGGYNLPINYTDMLIFTLSIIFYIAVFYFLPIIFIVKYVFVFNLRFKELPHTNNAKLNTIRYSVSLNNLYRLNNVIRCWNFVF